MTLWLLELEEQSLLRYVTQVVTICVFQTSYFRHTAVIYTELLEFN